MTAGKTQDRPATLETRLTALLIAIEYKLSRKQANPRVKISETATTSPDATLPSGCD